MIYVYLPVHLFRGKETVAERQVWGTEWDHGSDPPFLLQYTDRNGVDHDYLFDVETSGPGFVGLTPLVIHEKQGFERHLQGWGFRQRPDIGPLPSHRRDPLGDGCAIPSPVDQEPGRPANQLNEPQAE